VDEEPDGHREAYHKDKEDPRRHALLFLEGTAASRAVHGMPLEFLGSCLRVRFRHKFNADWWLGNYCAPQDRNPAPGWGPGEEWPYWRRQAKCREVGRKIQWVSQQWFGVGRGPQDIVASARARRRWQPSGCGRSASGNRRSDRSRAQRGPLDGIPLIGLLECSCGPAPRKDAK
jgi:hypothetical protein